jgi:hypothetical protein
MIVCDNQSDLYLRLGALKVARSLQAALQIRRSLSCLRHDAVSHNLAVFNDWNAIIRYHHGPRRIDLDLLGSVVSDGYDQPKVATARGAKLPDLARGRGVSVH